MTDLPVGWTAHPLGELVDILDYARVPVSAKERAVRPGAVPYYGAVGRVGWIDGALFDEPLVLLGEDGVQFFDPDKPKAYLIDGPSWVNNHAHVLRAREGLVAGPYLNYYLNQADYRGFANGTTRLKLTQGAMKQLPVWMPDLVEQWRIVDILDDHLSRLDAASKLMRSSEKRLSAWTQGRIDQAVWGPDAPRRPVGQLLSEPMRNGHSARAVKPGEPGVRTLTLTAVTRAEFTDQNTKLASADERRVADLWLRPRDILVQRSNTPELVGTSALFDGPEQWAMRFSHLVPRSSEVRTRAAAAIAVMRWGQTVTRSSARQRPSRAWARSVGARSAVINSL